MLSQFRKLELLKYVRPILHDLVDPLERNAVVGPESMAQEILNRIESIPKLTSDDMKYLVDAITTMIFESKGKEMKVAVKGRVLSKEELFKDYGMIIPTKQKPNV